MLNALIYNMKGLIHIFQQKSLICSHHAIIHLTITNSFTLHACVYWELNTLDLLQDVLQFCVVNIINMHKRTLQLHRMRKANIILKNNQPIPIPISVNPVPHKAAPSESLCLPQATLNTYKYGFYEQFTDKYHWISRFTYLITVISYNFIHVHVCDYSGQTSRADCPVPLKFLWQPYRSCWQYVVRQHGFPQIF